MKRLVEVISHKTLSTTLKELENDDLIIRKEYPQIPPKVEYSLSKKGESLIPILNEMCIWGKKNKKNKGVIYEFNRTKQRINEKV